MASNTTTVDGVALPATQAADIAFENGINANGTLGTVNYYTWDGNDPATYTNRYDQSAHKWGTGTIGSASGPITYAFSPASLWTPAEQQGLQAAMALWSDETGTQFTQAPGLVADFTFVRGSLSSTSETSINFSAAPPGSATAAADGLNGSVVLDTFTYGEPYSFSQYAGYGVSTAVHELGHVLGLGHAGPYNGNVDPPTQQGGPYDSRLYSIMSYIDPATRSARYYGQYAVGGTDWGTDASGDTRAPYTPMMDDILAAQQIYGAPASGALTQTQTFGFNTTISDATRPFFDFTVDTTPVITVFDTAPNNTLDLSGFSSASFVNLNQGAFSSADGLTNNIGIAYGTRVDGYVGGSGSNTVTLNYDTDAIKGGSGANVLIAAGSAGQYQVSTSNGTTRLVGDGQNATATNVQVVEFGDGTAVETTPDTVYRFYDTVTQGHFFTDSASEVASIAASNSVLKLEGPAFISANPATDPGAVQVYRFYEASNDSHFYTDSLQEVNQLRATDRSLAFEGPAFYVDPTQQAGDVPVYRLYESMSDTHLYTESASEVAGIQASRPDITLEGPAFYVKAS